MPAYANTFPPVSISPGDSAQVWVTVDGNLYQRHKDATRRPHHGRREAPRQAGHARLFQRRTRRDFSAVADVRY